MLRLLCFWVMFCCCQTEIQYVFLFILAGETVVVCVFCSDLWQLKTCYIQCVQCMCYGLFLQTVFLILITFIYLEFDACFNKYVIFSFPHDSSLNVCHQMS
jgi:hypothetical protein